MILLEYIKPIPQLSAKGDMVVRKTVLISLMILMICLCVGASAEVVLPSNAKTIKDNAFEGDTSLTGLLVLPSTIKTIGARAFASTGLYALEIPYGCTSIGADAVSGSGMTYVYLRGSNTTLASGALSGATYVFAPYGSDAVDLPNAILSGALVLSNNVYYKQASTTSLHALCPRDPAALSSTLTIPKKVNGIPVTSLSGLKLTDCTKVTTLKIPAYLTAPSGTGKTIVTYQTMSLSAPSPNNTPAIGTATTFTVTPTGHYGSVTYQWTITNGSSVTTKTTTTPSLTTTPSQSSFKIAVVATDAVGDSASSSRSYTLTAGNPVTYRALLIGNTYAGTEDELGAPLHDAQSVKAMLSLYPGTKYSATVKSELSKSGIKSAITSVLGAADSNDVSIFYFSGHGTPSGQLYGTGKTYVSVSELRSWLDSIKGTKIVLLNSCYSGAHINKSMENADPASFNRAVISAFASKEKGNLATNNYVVMTACSKNEVGWSHGVSYNSGPWIWYGVFTYGFCQASGYDMIHDTVSSPSADKNGDGAITLYECYVETDRLVREKREGKQQQSTQYYGPNGFVLWRK